MRGVVVDAHINRHREAVVGESAKRLPLREPPPRHQTIQDADNILELAAKQKLSRVCKWLLKHDVPYTKDVVQKALGLFDKREKSTELKERTEIRKHPPNNNTTNKHNILRQLAVVRLLGC